MQPASCLGCMFRGFRTGNICRGSQRGGGVEGWRGGRAEGLRTTGKAVPCCGFNPLKRSLRFTERCVCVCVSRERDVW